MTYQYLVDVLACRVETPISLLLEEAWDWKQRIFTYNPAFNKSIDDLTKTEKTSGRQVDGIRRSSEMLLLSLDGGIRGGWVIRVDIDQKPVMSRGVVVDVAEVPKCVHRDGDPL